MRRLINWTDLRINPKTMLVLWALIGRSRQERFSFFDITPHRTVRSLLTCEGSAVTFQRIELLSASATDTDEQRRGNGVRSPSVRIKGACESDVRAREGAEV